MKIYSIHVKFYMNGNTACPENQLFFFQIVDLSAILPHVVMTFHTNRSDGVSCPASVRTYCSIITLMMF